MPFSDPMADGPAIQASSQRALRAGQTMKKTLSMVREFRAEDDATPIVLMGYYNPIYVYPVDRFIADAVDAGVDGLIVVDVPPEEDEELRPAATRGRTGLIRLATPTTDAKRLPAVLANTSGFVYYVSIAGITGTAAPDIASVGAHVGRIKAPYGPAHRRRFRREDGRAGERVGRHRRRRGGRLGAGVGDRREPRCRRQGDERDEAATCSAWSSAFRPRCATRRKRRRFRARLERFRAREL